MDFRDLKYFEVIAREGNLGRAAEKLFRSQPALSKCIDRLEESLGGQKLFEREGRHLRLTAAGAVLMSRVKQMSLVFDDTMREMQEHATGLKGHVRIGCIPTLAEHLLPQVCRELIEDSSDVTIRLIVSMNDVLIGALRHGDVDLMVGPILGGRQEFESEQIAEDHMVVMASQDHEIFRRPYTLKDLLDYKWVLPATTVASRQWLDQTFDRNHLPRPQVQIEPTVLNLILPVIEQTHLLGFLTRANLRPGKAPLREVELAETTMHRRFGVFYRKNAYLPPVVHRVVELLRSRGKSVFIG